MSDNSSDTSLRFIPQSDKCPRCFVLFDYIKRTGNNFSKLPLILPCNHVLCEDCLHKLAIKENNKCPICQHAFEIPKCNFDMVPSGRTIRDRQNGKPSNSNQSDELLSAIQFDDSVVVEDVNYLKFKKCTEHFDKDNDIYCKTCSLAICSYCFVETHTDHTPIHLYKLTDKEQVVLKDSIAYLKTVLNSLYQSLKKLDQLQTADYTDIKKEIKNYFTAYHGKLHLIEKQLLDRLNNCNNIGNYNTEDEKFVIQQTIHRIIHILTIYKTIKTTKSINIKALLKEVQTLKNAPCQLVLEQQHGSGDNAQFVQFIADQDLDNLENKFQISQPNCVNYHLIPYECDGDKLSTITASSLSLPSEVAQSNYNENNRLTVNYEDINCAQSSSSSSRSTTSLQGIKKESEISDDNLTDNMTADSITGEIQSLQFNKPTEHRIKDKLREVIVTHLNDLDSFYVQTIQSQTNLKDLSKQLRNVHKKAVTPDKLVINNLYLVCYNIKGNNYWRRGRLIRIVDNKDATKSCEIFYIDYGNKQLVALDKLYLLHNCISRQPFAFHCKLKRPSTLIWNEEVRLNFIQIVKNKELLLKRCNKQHKQSSGLAEDVELFVRDSNHSLMQIVDLLLKNDSSYSLDQKIILKNPLKLFTNTTNFVTGQKEFVNITIINDPYNIYIQLVRNVKYLDELRRNMDNYFIKNQRYSCIPAENSDVIVKHQGNWYRAHVQTVCLPEKIAQVLLVDYGNIVDVSWNDIKQLPEEFCRIETQAIRIKLADIKSVNNTWSDDVRNFLIDQLIDEKRIKMVVNSIQPHLEVGLFKEIENGEICINAQLVEQKLAESSGPLSETVFWSYDETENKFDDNLLLAKTLQEREDDLANDVDEDPEATIGFKESIIVVKYKDPSLIYIKFKSNLEKEDLLLKELQIHYNDVRTKKKAWKCNELCVIWDEASGCYRRGSIHRKMPNFNRYIIYLYDELREIELDIASIFIYDQYFQDNYLDFVYKCYLANIRPAGDGKQWTKASIEMLEQIFRYRKDFYVKKIEYKSKSPRIFGCIMWYALTITGTALLPTKKRFISINNLFVQSGLALNIKQTDNITNKLLDDAHVVKEQPSKIGECFTKTWPTYLPIKEKEFDAKIICIDTNGIFYIRTHEFDELYKELETKMKEQFDNTDDLVKRTNWTYGEMCTIKYEDYWYRGTISNNNCATNQITVEMIDFASEHQIDYNDLSPEIMFPDVAPLLQRIRLFNIYPANGDYWPATVYEKVYSLVESDIHVIIKSDLKQSLPLAEIYSRNGKNLNQFLVDNCDELIGYNKSLKMDIIDCYDDHQEEEEEGEGEEDLTDGEDNNDNNEPIVNNSTTTNRMNWTEDDDVIVEKFYYAPLSTGQMSEMFIVNVLKYNEIVLCYNNKQSDHLKLLTDNIEETIDEQPMLHNPSLDQPCVAFIKSEKKWARAKILNLNSYGFATVFFVDYAIIEMIVTSDIKQIKPEWLHLLVANYIASINVVLSNTNEENRYFNRLKASIGESVLVEIINDDPLTVELHPKE